MTLKQNALIMKSFLDENFLLQNKTAERLYHDYAEPQPVIDFHCHLPVKDIAEDHRFRDLQEIWLAGDHYKWRAMRTNGVDERYCTGEASPWEKFEKWAGTVPYTVRNPLYHWTHLELKRYFGITDLLNPDTAKKIWDTANRKLQQPDYSCRNLLKKMNVVVVCTTDDPADSLKDHEKLQADFPEVKVYPAFRPDKAMAVENPESYNAYLNKLAEAADTEISCYQDLLEALRKRHDFFNDHGCRLSDHGIDTFYAEEYTEEEVDKIFRKVRTGKKVSFSEAGKIKTALLTAFAEMDYERGWVQQYHYGAMRNNNTLMYKKLGADTGFDSIDDLPVARKMSRFLDRLASREKLTRTILYNLNPADNELVATMTGNFQDGSVPGKIQFGAAWWFLDQKEGMEKQLNTLSSLGLLSRFVGMLTDSRSFMSYPRHEYFRRILCNLIGDDVEKGLLPADDSLLGPMVQNICYNNAKEYFNF